MLTLMLYGFLIAVFSIVYVHIISEQKILNWWFVFGNRYEKKWFFSPIWGCELCVAGQISLWSYVGNIIATCFEGNYPVISHIIWGIVPYYGVNTLSFWQLVLFITWTISLSWILYKGFEFIKK